jgi:hypothetical protein
MNFIDEVRRISSIRLLFTRHALDQMIQPDRLITKEDVISVVNSGEIIEDYPEDSRGHSCLMLGEGVDGRKLHVNCAPKMDHLVIITAYVPNLEEWDEEFRKRRR